MVLLSDGENDESFFGQDEELDDKTLRNARTAAQQDVRISTIALGEGADAALLSEVANITGGTFETVINASDLPRVFQRVAGEATVNQGNDTDGDGLSDTLERRGIRPLHDPTMNVTLNATNPDTDGDGIPDGEEVDRPARIQVNGSAVTVFRFASDPRYVDTDGDGLSDFIERDMGTDAFDTDSDGDGLSDSEDAYAAPGQTRPEPVINSPSQRARAAAIGAAWGELKQGTEIYATPSYLYGWVGTQIGLDVGGEAIAATGVGVPVGAGAKLLAAGADVRDLGANLWQGDYVDAGFDAVGIAVSAGEAVDAVHDIGRWATDATSSVTLAGGKLLSKNVPRPATALLARTGLYDALGYGRGFDRLQDSGLSVRQSTVVIENLPAGVSPSAIDRTATVRDYGRVVVTNRHVGTELTANSRVASLNGHTARATTGSVSGGATSRVSRLVSRRLDDIGTRSGELAALSTHLRSGTVTRVGDGSPQAARAALDEARTVNSLAGSLATETRRMSTSDAARVARRADRLARRANALAGHADTMVRTGSGNTVEWRRIANDADRVSAGARRISRTSSRLDSGVEARRLGDDATQGLDVAVDVANPSTGEVALAYVRALPGQANSVPGLVFTVARHPSGQDEPWLRDINDAAAAANEDIEQTAIPGRNYTVGELRLGFRAWLEGTTAFCFTRNELRCSTTPSATDLSSTTPSLSAPAARPAPAAVTSQAGIRP
jgi:hypothetical protein